MVALGSIQTLAYITEGQLYLDSQDIAGALFAQGIDQTDCGFTGLVEINDERGWETQQVWATNWSRPFDLVASYTLIWDRGALAPVEDWPMA